MAKAAIKPIKLYCVVAAWSEGGTSLVNEYYERELEPKKEAK